VPGDPGSVLAELEAAGKQTAALGLDDGELRPGLNLQVRPPPVIALFQPHADSYAI
jgi:hypothetical protein